MPRRWVIGEWISHALGGEFALWICDAIATVVVPNFSGARSQGINRLRAVYSEGTGNTHSLIVPPYVSCVRVGVGPYRSRSYLSFTSSSCHDQAVSFKRDLRPGGSEATPTI